VLWRERYDPQGGDQGVLQVVSEPRFYRYPQVQSTYRITLPTDVVEFSVKTILLKMSWIDLSSLHFSPYLCFSPLTFASFEFFLLPSFSSLGSYVGGRSLAFILLGPFFGSSSSSM
jgi:hypothetical protein